MHLFRLWDILLVSPHWLLHLKKLNWSQNQDIINPKLRHHWDPIETHLSGCEIEKVGQRRFSSKMLRKKANFFYNLKLKKNEILESGKNDDEDVMKRGCNFGSQQHQSLTLTIVVRISLWGQQIFFQLRQWIFSSTRILLLHLKFKYF